MLVRYVLLIYIIFIARARLSGHFLFMNINERINAHMLYMLIFSCGKLLQMEGDIRSNSSDEVSDTSVNNTPVNSTANYINKSNSKPKAH